MKVVFFGNSDVSVLPLRKIREFADVFVITSSDKPAGRGLNPKPNPVKLFCLDEKIHFVELTSWEDVRKSILDFRPDFFVVASFGKIIPSDILSILPERRRINIHPSLLPRWRGPAPVQWTILSGDSETGLTICTVTEKPDAGDIVFQEKLKLYGDEKASYLQRKLFELSSFVIQDVLEDIIYGRARFFPQDEKSATWARLIKKEDGYFSFSESSKNIWKKFRAFDIWPKIFTKIKGENVIIHDVEMPSDFDEYKEAKVGEIIRIDGSGIWVICGDGFPIILKSLQRAGKKIILGKDFANGMRLKVGDNLMTE